MNREVQDETCFDRNVEEKVGHKSYDDINKSVSHKIVYIQQMFCKIYKENPFHAKSAMSYCLGEFK